MASLRKLEVKLEEGLRNQLALINYYIQLLVKFEANVLLVSADRSVVKTDDACPKSFNLWSDKWVLILPF